MTFGMVLNAKAPFFSALEALDGPVIEIDVRDSNSSWKSLFVDRIAMVLRSHVDLAEQFVFDRMVTSSVSELQLVSAGAQSSRQNLVTHADSENGSPP